MEPDRSVLPGAGNRGWLGEDGLLHVLGAWRVPAISNDRETPSAAELMLGARTGSRAVPRRRGRCRWNTSAQRIQRSAILLHVALLAGSRVNFAICWHSAACLRNSSDGSMKRVGCMQRISSLIVRAMRRGSAGRNCSAYSDSRSQHKASSRHRVRSAMSDDPSASCRHSARTLLIDVRRDQCRSRPACRSLPTGYWVTASAGKCSWLHRLIAPRGDTARELPAAAGAKFPVAPLVRRWATVQQYRFGLAGKVARGTGRSTHPSRPPRRRSARAADTAEQWTEHERLCR